MANRCTLHKTKLEAFKSFLDKLGIHHEPPSCDIGWQIALVVKVETSPEMLSCVIKDKGGDDYDHYIISPEIIEKIIQLSNITISGLDANETMEIEATFNFHDWQNEPDQEKLEKESKPEIDYKLKLMQILECIDEVEGSMFQEHWHDYGISDLEAKQVESEYRKYVDRK